MKNKLIYLAIPYSHDPETSYKIANEVAAEIMQDGYIVFSPISHSHYISCYMKEELRFNYDFWMKQDLPLLRKCDEVWFILIGDDGWKKLDESKGCVRELKESKLLKIKRRYYHYDTKRVFELP